MGMDMKSSEAETNKATLHNKTRKKAGGWETWQGAKKEWVWNEVGVECGTDATGTEAAKPLSIMDNSDVPSVRKRRKRTRLADRAQVQLIPKILYFALIILHKATLYAQTGNFILGICKPRGDQGRKDVQSLRKESTSRTPYNICRVVD